MGNKQKSEKKRVKITFRKGRPMSESDCQTLSNPDIFDFQSLEKPKDARVIDHYIEQEQHFRSEFTRFVEVSKYYSSPQKQSATYMCENRLVSYPNPFRVEYKPGGITSQRIKFSNLTLEPVYVKLYKLIPDLEQIKYINLSLSGCKRVPPGLAFNLGFVYDDTSNEKPSTNAKMIFVASRKTTTPCYQLCQIELVLEPIKNPQ